VSADPTYDDEAVINRVRQQLDKNHQDVADRRADRSPEARRAWKLHTDYLRSRGA
jgi:hypothetical protein